MTSTSYALYSGFEWKVEFDADCATWMETLDDQTYESVMAAIAVLRLEGPSLGRPLVDRVAGSRFANMKEFRPPAPGKQTIRLLFIFDPQRAAFFLVGGNKTDDWLGWYRRNIPIADARYERHLAELQRREGLTK